MISANTLIDPSTTEGKNREPKVNYVYERQRTCACSLYNYMRYTYAVQSSTYKFKRSSHNKTIVQLVKNF